LAFRHFAPRGALEDIIWGLTLIEQSRQAEYDRLTALPVGRTLGNLSGEFLISRGDDVATKLAH
jgi:hypothetical protein